LDRCIGCFACVVACKQENKLPEGNNWVKVHVLGPEEVKGKLRAEYFVTIAEDCTLCEHRIQQGLEPFCVSNCPVKALTFGTADKLLECLETKRKFQIAKLKALIIEEPIRRQRKICNEFL